MGKLRLSKSKIGAYQWCARQFYLVNFTSEGKARSKTLVTKEMTDGSLLHEYYEKHNKATTPSEIEYLHTIEETLFEDEFYLTNIKNYYKILENFTLTRATHSEKKLYDKEMDCVGIVDAIYKQPDGTNLLVDYKSGKFSKGSMTSYRFELMLYTVLVERNMDIKIDYCGMFFTSHPDDSFMFKVKPNMQKKAIEKFNKYYKLISDGVFPKTTYYKTCQNCGYADLCASCNLIDVADEEVIEVTV